MSRALCWLAYQAERLPLPYPVLMRVLPWAGEWDHYYSQPADRRREIDAQRLLFQ